MVTNSSPQGVVLGAAGLGGDALQLAFYEQFFFTQNLEPYPVQEQAFEHIFAGRSVLVTVPTGTGKTLMAKAALYCALQRGQTAVYTVPLRALTEEKFRELCDDFGEHNVGFATGDYKVRPDAPIQVVVAEILWNRIFADKVRRVADLVVMDEGHYFNDVERGYVWEQSILGLDPRTQLVILSATVGNPQEFCQWVYLARRVELHLVESFERRVPLEHVYREEFMVEVVRDLFQKGEYPAIIFTFGREQCFERARLLKSCRRFTTDEERERIAVLSREVLLGQGVRRELEPLLLHGVGLHHAGILPKYKQLVERLTLERLLKFVVSTETISAGINLPAKRVIFPELRKYIQKSARLLLPAEYHQMAGRAGRPQFDTEGVAITLAPEQFVQELRKELKEEGRGGRRVDEERLRKNGYARLRIEAQKNNDVTWDPDSHAKLVAGKPAALTSQTRVTPDQILAIGLPPAANHVAPAPPLGGAADASSPQGNDVPLSLRLDVRTVIDHLLLPARDKLTALERLDQVVENLRALGVVDDDGRQVAGEIVRTLRGVDGLFVYYALSDHDLSYEECRELVELLVDHVVVHKLVTRKQDEKKNEWIRNRLRERRREDAMVTWDDVAEEYDRAFPRELSPVEQLHAAFLAKLPHPELHGGKLRKLIWSEMETDGIGFLEYVERHGLAHEEGSLFTYLARVMKVARSLADATGLDEFRVLEGNVRRVLVPIDERVLEEW
jgi:hypothetical protein